MTLFDFVKKAYRISLKCTNCGLRQEVSIKKGITIKEAINDKQIVCENCGCATLYPPAKDANTTQEIR